MQTVDCSAGNSFLINHETGTARVTVLDVTECEVKLAVATTSGDVMDRQIFVIRPEKNADVLALLKSRAG